MLSQTSHLSQVCSPDAQPTVVQVFTGCAEHKCVHLKWSFALLLSSKRMVFTFKPVDQRFELPSTALLMGTGGGQLSIVCPQPGQPECSDV